MRVNLQPMAAATGKRARTRTVPIDPRWLDLLNERVRAEKKDRNRDEKADLVTLGKRLAKAINRPKAFPKSQVDRYLKGKVTTEDMTRAFSKLFELPYPVASAANPTQARGFELVVSLDEAQVAGLLDFAARWLKAGGKN